MSTTISHGDADVIIATHIEQIRRRVSEDESWLESHTADKPAGLLVGDASNTFQHSLANLESWLSAAQLTYLGFHNRLIESKRLLSSLLYMQQKTFGVPGQSFGLSRDAPGAPAPRSPATMTALQIPGVSDWLQPSACIMNILRDTSDLSRLEACPNLLNLRKTGGSAELRCRICQANTNDKYDLLLGIQGLINHIRDQHRDTWMAQVAADPKEYIFRNCVKRLISRVETRDIELDPMMQSRVGPGGVPVNHDASRILRLSYDPGSDSDCRIVRLKADPTYIRTNESVYMKVGCAYNNCEAPSQDFRSIKELIEHLKAFHGEPFPGRISALMGRAKKKIATLEVLLERQKIVDAAVRDTALGVRATELGASSYSPAAHVGQIASTRGEDEEAEASENIDAESADEVDDSGDFHDISSGASEYGDSEYGDTSPVRATDDDGRIQGTQLPNAISAFSQNDVDVGQGDAQISPTVTHDTLTSSLNRLSVSGGNREDIRNAESGFAEDYNDYEGDAGVTVTTPAGSLEQEADSSNNAVDSNEPTLNIERPFDLSDLKPHPRCPMLVEYQGDKYGLRCRVPDCGANCYKGGDKPE